MAESELASAEYEAVLDALKERVRIARIRAAVSVNRELVFLYWQIGREIRQRQQALGWGARVIDRLSRDLRNAFPDMKGLSPRNLKYMRAFAEAWPDEVLVQRLAAQIPWFHNCLLLDKVKDAEGRAFYVQRTVEAGWSRSVLAMQIANDLHGRHGRAVTNFKHALTAPDSDLAHQTLKDPYIFDFLGLEEDAKERDIERAMIRHLKETLIELGVGFAFVGQQFPIEVGEQEFFLDLLFYHLKLHCYVVVELKAGDFEPEHAGKLNFYLSAVDDLVRDADVDGPTIGLLLCRSKNRVVAEYALRDIGKPIGVAEIQLTRLLPERLEGTLPSVETLEAELSELSEPVDADVTA